MFRDLERKREGQTERKKEEETDRHVHTHKQKRQIQKYPFLLEMSFKGLLYLMFKKLWN